jgi:hypothetical protein
MVRHKVIGTNHFCYIVVLHSLKFKKTKYTFRLLVLSLAYSYGTCP